MFLNTFTGLFFSFCLHRKETFRKLELMLQDDEKKIKWKKEVIQHCASMHVMHTQTHTRYQGLLWYTHTLKSSFETYKNALKNMYIDIFVCIQIGPSQQNKRTYYSHVWVLPMGVFRRASFLFFFLFLPTARGKAEQYWYKS